MDNPKRYKQTKKGQIKPIDGFVRRKSTPGSSGFEFRRHTSYQPARENPDGLRRTERYFQGDVRQPRDSQMLPRQSFAPQGPPNLELPEEPKARTPRHSKARIAMQFFTVLFLSSVIMGGYFFGKGYLKARQIFKGGGRAVALQENADPATLNGEGDGRVNIMLLGGGGEEYDNASYLTDTIMVVSIDPIQKEAAILSIPRDFYIRTEYGSMRINAVYKTARNAFLDKYPRDKPGSEKAGFDAMEKAVQQTMGIPVHYHAMIDFTGFKKAVDTVGGISLNVKDSVYENMYIDGHNYVLNVKPGQQNFDGFRALAYARSRHTSPRGDFDRSERQRQMLVALKDKILTLNTLTNPVKINQLFSDFGNHMQTNLSVNELLRLRDIGTGITGAKVQSISLVDEPNVLIGSANIAGASLQIPKAGLGNYKDIQNFVRNKLKDGFLQSENATVAVLNGTNTGGLAARTADELKSYGYNISQIADSPIKNQQQTILVDLRRGVKKYTKAYLQKRFGVTVVESLPDARIDPGTADFVIILGQNEQSRLNN